MTFFAPALYAEYIPSGGKTITSNFPNESIITISKFDNDSVLIITISKIEAFFNAEKEAKHNLKSSILGSFTAITTDIKFLLMIFSFLW